MRMEYETVVVGATCAGLGYALSHPDGTLLVESSSSVGGEFIEAMDPGVGWGAPAGLGPEAESLRDELVTRNILDGDRLHLPAVAAVLFARLKESRVAYRFWTDILATREQGSGFELTLFDTGGRSTIRASRILDTTTRAVSLVGEPTGLDRKAIGATLSCPNPPDEFPASGSEAACALHRGRFPGEAFLVLDLPLEADWPAARRRLHGFWLSRPAALRDWHLASVGARLIERPAWRESPSERWTLLPSARFENLLAAYDAGAAVRNEVPAH